ncbi:cytidine deaminase family protein [Streptomyces corynorhini]|uniref:Cytidine deaminase n=1 Tax=Streptomyces corynorhini TaxID=2282652 RepID=A0A370BIF5_9ACTN|nr:cytidine deaminase [Streptomyces corynorhini]RDG39553.1 cytidine deaminase [Streptomyces corynorhini]
MLPPAPPAASDAVSDAASAGSGATAASAAGTAVDHGLIEAATTTARARARGDSHTVAAAARAGDGRVVTAMNAYHFTGGPCAELVLVGAAAAQGIYDLTTIVAVGDGERGLMPPCGRCRQFLFDYFPTINVIVGTDEHPRTLTIAELLPEAYVWSDHQD